MPDSLKPVPLYHSFPKKELIRRCLFMNRVFISSRCVSPKLTHPQHRNPPDITQSARKAEIFWQDFISRLGPPSLPARKLVGQRLLQAIPFGSGSSRILPCCKVDFLQRFLRHKTSQHEQGKNRRRLRNHG